MERVLLEVNGVWKRLCRRPEKALRYAIADIGRDITGRSPGHTLRDGEFWALQNVDFEIEAGEVLGVIGHNGAGKSTLINVVAGVILPTLGSVAIHTERVAVVDHSGGLNPIETGRENAITQLALHGVPDEVIAEEMRAIEVFAEIGDFIDAPVGTYSLGMRLRLAFSIYSRLKPDLFIIDEALGGGDLRFRNKFRSFLRDYVDGGGAILLCSHEMMAIQSFCDRCLLLDRGRVIMSGPPVMMVNCYHEVARQRQAEAASKQAAATSDGGSKSDGSSVNANCELVSVTVSAEGGGRVRPGSAVVIEVTIDVREETEGVACVTEIGRGEMNSIATLTFGYTDTPFTLRPPRARLVCRIKSLPLAPGMYDVRVALSLPGSTTVLAMRGYEDAADSFTVVPPINEVANLVRGRQNLVHMETEWQMTNDAATRDSVDRAADSPDPVSHSAGNSPE